MTVTPHEAVENIGRLVVYQPPQGPEDRARPHEEGKITGASMSYVFVDFGGVSHPACRPEDLTFSLTPSPKES